MGLLKQTGLLKRALLGIGLGALGLASAWSASALRAADSGAAGQGAHPAEPSTRPSESSAGEPGKQTPEVFDQKFQLKYLLYLPQDYGKESAKAWPLVLFLHGSGERGTDLDVVKKHGPPKLVAEGKQFPFILVSPQCPPKQWWDPQALNGLLDDVEAKYHVDPNRVYVTGLSMGGFGTWEMARRYPHKFAAIVPICGGGDPQSVKAFAQMPVWAFHGEADPTVPIRRTQEMVDALKKAGDTDVKFTHYPNVGHDSWVKAYEDPELYTWLLSHKREAPAKEDGK